MSNMKTPHVRTKPLIDAPRFGSGLNCHRRVAAIAIEMANVLFEEYMRSDALYRHMRANGRVTEKQARTLFVERVAPRMLEDARKALTDMLAQPDVVVPQAVKDEIAEALILDTQLRAKRFVAESDATTPAILH